jgi:hypothetical protein
MADAADPALVTEVARGIVADVAPDELPMFELTSEAYLQDPRRAEAGGDSDEMLGFGGGAEMELLTPVVLTITSGVVSYLITTVLNAAKSEGQTLIQQQVKLFFKRFNTEQTPKPGAPALTRDQLIEVRRVAYDIASRSGVPAAQAALLADSTVGQLVVAV